MALQPSYPDDAIEITPGGEPSYPADASEYEMPADAAPLPAIGMGDLRQAAGPERFKAAPILSKSAPMDAGTGLKGSSVDPWSTFKPHSAFTGYVKDVEATHSQESTSIDQERQRLTGLLDAPPDELAKAFPDMVGMPDEAIRTEVSRKLNEDLPALSSQAGDKRFRSLEDARVEGLLLQGKRDQIRVGQRTFMAKGDDQAQVMSKGTARFVISKTGKVYLGGQEIPLSDVRRVDPVAADIAQGGATMEAPHKNLVDAFYGTNDEFDPGSYIARSKLFQQDLAQQAKRIKWEGMKANGRSGLGHQLMDEFANGLANTTLSPMAFVARAIGRDDIADDISRKLQSLEGATPDEQRNLLHGIANGAGSLVPSLALGGGVGAVVEVSGISSLSTAARWGTSVLVGQQEAAAEGANAYDQVIQDGGTPEAAKKAMWITFAGNAVLNPYFEKLGIFSSEAGSSIRRVMMAHMAEGGQEWYQQLIQNAATGKPLFEGAGESALVGAILGGSTKGLEQMYRNSKAGDIHTVRRARDAAQSIPLPTPTSREEVIPNGQIPQVPAQGQTGQTQGQTEQTLLKPVPGAATPEAGRPTPEPEMVQILQTQIQHLERAQASGQDVTEELAAAQEMLRQEGGEPALPADAVPISTPSDSAPVVKDSFTTPAQIIPQSKAKDLGARVKEEGQWALDNRPAFDQVYDANPDTAEGVILSADAMAGILPSIDENPTEGHGWAVESGHPSKYILDRFDERMQVPAQPGQSVMITMGNAGAGKTTLAKQNAGEYTTILDSTGSDATGLVENINKGLRSGYVMDIAMPIVSLEVAVERNVRRQGKIGRPVPLGNQADLEASTLNAFSTAWETFGDPANQGQVSFTVIVEDPANPGKRKALRGQEAADYVNSVREENGKSSLLDRAINAYVQVLGAPDVNPSKEARAVFEQDISERVKARQGADRQGDQRQDRKGSGGIQEAPSAPKPEDSLHIDRTEHRKNDTVARLEAKAKVAKKFAPRKKAEPTSSNDIRAQVLAALQATADPGMAGLMDIPKAVTELKRQGLSQKDIHAVLLSMNHKEISLQPESFAEAESHGGSGRAVLSPAGLNGTYLTRAALLNPTDMAPRQELFTPTLLSSLRGTAAATIQVQAERAKPLSSGWRLFAEQEHHLKLISPDGQQVVFGPLLDSGLTKVEELRARASMFAWADENPVGSTPKPKASTLVQAAKDLGKLEIIPVTGKNPEAKNPAVQKMEEKGKAPKDAPETKVGNKKEVKEGDKFTHNGREYSFTVIHDQVRTRDLTMRGGPPIVRNWGTISEFEHETGLKVVGKQYEQASTPPLAPTNKVAEAQVKTAAAFKNLMKIVSNPNQAQSFVGGEAFDAAVELAVALSEEGVVRFQDAIARVLELAGGSFPEAIKKYFENAWDALAGMDDKVETRTQTVDQHLAGSKPAAPVAPGIPGALAAGLSLAKGYHAVNKRDTWVAKMANRVSEDTYKALKNMAEAMGGYYSKFKGSGAIPGFQFKTESEAKAFLAAVLPGKGAGHVEQSDSTGTGLAGPGPQGATGSGQNQAQPDPDGGAGGSEASPTTKPEGPRPETGSVGTSGGGISNGGNPSVRPGGVQGQPGGTRSQRTDLGGGRARLLTMDGAFSLPGSEAATYLENINLTSEKQKLNAAKIHLEIIRLIKRLEAEGRLLQATPEEKELLAKWVGWGALKDAVDEGLLKQVKYYKEKNYPIPEGWESWAKVWQSTTEAVLGELTAAQVDAARKSILNAHYTAIPVVQTIWDMIRQFGFTGGNMLEPSIGSGVFAGMMPADLRGATSVTGVELDPITARVAQALYPEAQIFEGDFEGAPVRNGSMDLVLTNVPFSHEIRKQGHSLHNWFFLEGLRKVRPGGMMVAITSLGTMDAVSSKHREELARVADLVGAIRLPSNAFAKNAGTEVPTDLLVFRRKDAVPFQANSFQGTINVDLGNDRSGTPQSDDMNEYFAENPHQILGDFAINTMNGRQSGMTVHWNGSEAEFKTAFATALGALPKGWAQNGIPTSTEARSVVDKNAQHQVLDGTLALDGAGKALVHYGGRTYTPAEWVSVRSQVKAAEEEAYRKGADAEIAPPIPRKISDQLAEEYNESAVTYISMKTRAKDLAVAEQNPDMTDAEIEAIRADLNRLYTEFTHRGGEHKPINNTLRNPHVADDPDSFEALALENVKTSTEKTKLGTIKITKTFEPADILKHRTGRPAVLVTTAANISEAATLSLLEKGRLDPEHMGKLLGIQPEVAELQALQAGVAFIDPDTNAMEAAWLYLSGNIREKLARAQAAAQENPTLQRNVDKLQEALPKPKPITQIIVKLGSTWIPIEVFQSFAKEVMGLGVTLQFEEITSTYKMDNKIRELDSALASKWHVELEKQPGSASPSDILKAALTWTDLKVMFQDEHGSSRENKFLTAMANDKKLELQKAFNEWMREENNPYTGTIERMFNERYNILVEPKMPEMPVKGFPGQATVFNSKPFAMESFQVEGTFAGLLRNTLLAHVVGSGKTITGGTIAMELRRLGKANRVTIATTRSVTQQFAAQIRQLYPAARILVRPSTGGKVARMAFLTRMATMDYDMAIVTHEDLTSIPDNALRVEAYVRAEKSKIESVVRGLDLDMGKKTRDPIANSLKDRLGWLDNLQAEAVASEEGSKKGGKKEKKAGDDARKNAKQAEKSKEARGKSLAQLLQRKTDKVLTWDDLKMDALIVDESHVFKRLDFWTQFDGLKGVDTDSSKRAMSTYLKTKSIHERNGRLVFMTGTPITNTMAEIWTNVRYLRPDILENMGISEYDAFVKSFGEISTQPELNASGVFKPVTRLRRFSNIPELRSMLGQVMHRVVSAQIKREALPVMSTGAPILKVSQPDPVSKGVTAYIRSVLAAWEGAGKVKVSTRFVPITAYTRAAQAALDPRLLDPYFPAPTQGKLVELCDTIMEHYRESEADKGAQVIFAEHYQSPKYYGPYHAFEMPEAERFNMLKEIKRMLVERGIPADEIVEKLPDGDQRRSEIFERVKTGSVRIIMGGTMNLGVGVNIQDRLIAAHHLELATTPANQEQRNGRIIRAGNMFLTPYVYYYATEGSADAFFAQTLDNKKRFADDIMDLSAPIDIEADDPGNISMSYEEMAAAFTGDTRVAEKIGLQNQMNLLQAEKDSFEMAKRQSRYEIQSLTAPDPKEWGSLAYRNARAKAAEVITEKTAPDLQEKILEGVHSKFVFTEKDKAGTPREILNTGTIKLADGWQFNLLDRNGKKGGLADQWTLTRNDVQMTNGNSSTPSGLKMSLTRELVKLPLIQQWAQEALVEGTAALERHQAMLTKEYKGSERLEGTKAKLANLSNAIEEGRALGLRKDIGERLDALQEGGIDTAAIESSLAEADHLKANGDVGGEIDTLIRTEASAYLAMASNGLTEEKRFTGSEVDHFMEWFPSMLSDKWWSLHGDTYRNAVEKAKAAHAAAREESGGEMGFVRPGLVQTIGITGLATVLVAGLTGSTLVAAATAVGIPVAVATAYLVYRGIGGVAPNFIGYIKKLRAELGTHYWNEAPKAKDYWRRGKELADTEDEALVGEAVRSLGDASDVTRMNPKDLSNLRAFGWKPWLIGQNYANLRPVIDLAVKVETRLEDIKHDFTDFLDTLKALPLARREAVTRAWNAGTREDWEEQVIDFNEDGKLEERTVYHHGKVWSEQVLNDIFKLNRREIEIYRKGLDAGVKLADLQIKEHDRRMGKLIKKLLHMLNIYEGQTGLNVESVAGKIKELKAAHTRALKVGDIMIADDLNLQIWALQESAAAGLSLRKWVWKKIREMKLAHIRLVDTLRNNEAYSPLHRMGDQQAVIVDPKTKEVLYVMAQSKWMDTFRRALSGRMEWPSEASINIAINEAAREYGVELKEGMVHKGTKYHMDQKLAGLTSPLDPTRLATLIDSVTQDPALVGVLTEDETDSLAELLKASAQVAKIKNYTAENRLRHHLLERKGTYGETLDGLAAWSSYVQSAAQSIAANEHMDDLQMAVERISKSEQPRLRAYAENMKAQMIAPDQMNPAVRNSIAVAAIYTIGGKVSFAIQNASQFMVEYQRLANRYGHAKALTASVQAQILAARVQTMIGLQKLGLAVGSEYLAGIDPFDQISNPKLRQVTEQAFTSGIFMDRVGDRISRYARGKAGGKLATGARGINTLLMAPASLSEQNNRIRAFIGYALAHTMLDPTATTEDLVKMAEDQVRHVHFERSSWNKSKLERSMGGLGSMLTMFQYYMHEFIHETGNAFRVAYMGEADAYKHGVMRTAGQMALGLTTPGSRAWAATKGLRSMSLMMYALAGATGFKLLFGLYDVAKDLLSALYRWLFNQPYDPTKDKDTLESLSESVFAIAKKQGLPDSAARMIHDITMHGASNAFNVDMSGSIAPGIYLMPDTTANPNVKGSDYLTMLGGVPGNVYSRIADAWLMWEKGEKEKAVRMALPAFAKHWQDAATGDVSLGGRQIHLTPAERVVKATGFTPTRLAHEYWSKDVAQKALKALGAVKSDLGVGLQRAMRDQFRAQTVEDRASAAKEVDVARRAIDQHNALMDQRIKEGNPGAIQFKIFPKEFIDKAFKEHLLQMAPQRGMPITMRQSFQDNRSRFIGDETESSAGKQKP